MNISWGFCVLLFILACLTIFWEYFLKSFTKQNKLGHGSQQQLSNKTISTNPTINNPTDTVITTPKIVNNINSDQQVLTRRLNFANDTTLPQPKLTSNSVKPVETKDLRKSRESIRRILQNPDYATNRIKTQAGATSIIADQDREYEMALLKDQEKEQREIEKLIQLQNERIALANKLENEKKILHDKEQHRLEKLRALPSEPELGPDISRLVIRFPDGERLDRRIKKDDKLTVICDFIESKHLFCTEYKYHIVTTFPKRVLSKEQTIEELGLFPHGVICVEEYD